MDLIIPRRASYYPNFATAPSRLCVVPVYPALWSSVRRPLGLGCPVAGPVGLRPGVGRRRGLIFRRPLLGR